MFFGLFFLEKTGREFLGKICYSRFITRRAQHTREEEEEE